jgi:hypothetical protein
MALTVAAGDIILADHLNALVPLSAVKAGTTSRNTTVTMTADPDLAITFPASTTWDFELLLFLVSAANAAGDFKCELSWTGTATVSAADVALSDALPSGVFADLAALGVPLDTTTPAGTWGFGTSTSTTNAQLFGHITTTTSSVLTLNWAQLASNGNNTSVLAGSKFVARRRL